MNNDEILQVLRDLRHELDAGQPPCGFNWAVLDAVRRRRIDVLKQVEKLLDDKGPRLDDDRPAMVVPDPDGVHPKRDWES
jgi:hypothetical protein